MFGKDKGGDKLSEMLNPENVPKGYAVIVVRCPAAETEYTGGGVVANIPRSDVPYLCTEIEFLRRQMLEKFHSAKNIKAESFDDIKSAKRFMNRNKNNNEEW